MKTLSKLGFSSVIALLFSMPVQADPRTLSQLRTLFSDHFYSGYTEGRCGENILQFLELSRRNRLDLSQAQVLVIENKGYSVFGMVNVEKAREAGSAIRPTPSRAPLREVGERNWYHHVVLVYDGHVFDFDFTNEPTVTTVSTYFESMFLDEDQKPGRGFYVGRDEKMKDYQLEIHLGADYYASATRTPPKPTQLRLGDYLAR